MYGLAASILDDSLERTYDFDPRGFCLTVVNDEVSPQGIAMLRSRWSATSLDERVPVTEIEAR